jgi:hypothetical protein
MGEAFLAAKQERFQHLRDSAVEAEFKSEDLLSRIADASTICYRCRRSDSTYLPIIGDAALIVANESGDLLVVHQNSVVGMMLVDDAHKLKEKLSGSPICMLLAVVTEWTELTEIFHLGLAEQQA